jgi:hypothetical protein
MRLKSNSIKVPKLAPHMSKNVTPTQKVHLSAREYAKKFQSPIKPGQSQVLAILKSKQQIP